MELSSQITRTKVIVPRRRPDLLSRQRLVDMCSELLDYKLFIVTAPAGYGKTSLLVDVAHHLDLPVCWYALDPLDQDPQRFLAHFVAALTYRFANFGRQSIAILDNISLDNPGLDRLVTTLVNECYEHIQEHFVLVLDDYHLLNKNKEINYFINQFVQQVDENCHLVISSRTLLSLPDLVLMVGRLQVGGLGLNELSFRPDEIQALLLQNYHLTLPQAEADELARETEGWITGLLLSAQTMWQGMGERLRLARFSGVGLYDFLAQQVLDQQSPPVQDFLLRTSLLEEFDAELCQAVLGPADNPDGTDWPELMETVIRHNLFVLPVDDKRTWLRYHHLFQDFLQGRIEAERPDEKTRILQRLAAVYADQQAWDKAHDLYRCLGDGAATAELIERAGLSLVKGGRLATLARWLDDLPAMVLTSRPMLLALRGYTATMLGEVERGLSLLNQAEVSFQRTGNQAALSRTLLWRSTAYRFLGKYQASLADADEALVLTEKDGCAGSIQAEALKYRGISLRMIGRLKEAIECLECSLASYNRLDEMQNTATVLLELGMSYIDAGRYEQALTYNNQALDYWRREDNVIWQANLLNNLGFLHHLRGDYEQAALTFEEALTHARQSGYFRLEAYILCGIGDVYADVEALDAARMAYRQARDGARQTNERFLLLYLDLAEAALARMEGDLSLAHGLLISAEELARESGSEYERGLQELEAGCLALARGQVTEAVTHHQQASRRFDRGGQRVEGAQAYLHRAIAHQDGGDEQASLENLDRAFQLASDLGSLHPLVVTGRKAMKLLKKAKSVPALSSQASRLLEQVTEFEECIPTLRRRLRQQVSTVPFAPPRLIIQALGQLRVLLDGQPVTTPEWQTQRRVREFFYFLLAHPQGLTRDMIGVDLWPESSPSQLKLQFKNTIYRLRRALIKEIVLFEAAEDRYYFNRQLDYEYDVEIFEKEIDRARRAIEPDKRATAYRAAIDRYQGPYLPEMDGPQIQAERERLAQAYLEANSALAEFHLEAGEYDLVLDYCSRILEADPYLEEAHRYAMRAYAALGNRAGVVRQFEQCQQSLREEIDVPVSPQTRSLYETLTR